MIEERWDIPPSWAWASMGDVAEVVGGGTPSTSADGNFAEAGIPWLTPADLTGYRDVYISRGRRDLSERGYKASAARIMPRGTVLFSSRAPVGYCAIAAGEISTNQGFKSFVLKGELSPEYVRHYLLGSVDYAESKASGTTFKELSGSRAAELAVPVPPLPEQRRIVAKIDSLTGKTRRARDHLDHIPRLVEKYKQAVLAAAFRGELIGLSTTETGLLHDRCWDLPGSWRWVRFSEVVEIASNLVKPEAIPDLPHIAPDNVEGGTGRLLPFRTIREDGVISAKHKFFAGQVVYSKIRPYLRKAVLVDFDGACSADMYPLTSNSDLDATYLLYWLISEPFAAFTVEHEGRTVLPKINQQGLNQTPVPLPPLLDQLETVRRLQTAFNWIDRLTSEATSARRLIDRLDQSVLAKAFRGELVPQDPEDEPASVLLDRIRVERSAAPKAKHGRKSKAVA